jgi:hypothetical protein
LQKRLGPDKLRAKIEQGGSTNKPLVEKFQELALVESLVLLLNCGVTLDLDSTPEEKMKNLDAVLSPDLPKLMWRHRELRNLLDLYTLCNRVQHGNESFWDLEHFVVTNKSFSRRKAQLVTIEKLLHGNVWWTPLLMDSDDNETAAWIHVPSTNVSNCSKSIPATPLTITGSCYSGMVVILPGVTCSDKHRLF